METSRSNQKVEYMTTEKVEKLVAKLAVPTIISMLITAFYNLADTFFIRQLQNDSLVAAVGVVLPLMSIIQAIGFFFGQGSGNYISRAFGSKNFDKAEKMAATGFFYALFAGLIIMIFGVIFQNQLGIILGAKTDNTLQATMKYMLYILLSAPLMCSSIVLNNQLRLQGNAFFAMIGLTTGAIVNIVLDPIFIYSKGDVIFSGAITVPFGLGMGIAGASLATAISQCISFILLLLGLLRSDNIKIKIKNFSFTLEYFKGIVQGGLPSLARQGLASLATTVLNHAVGLYIVGDVMIDAVQAALTGTTKIVQFFASAIIGFGQGFQPVCGFNYGAKKYKRVHRAFVFSIKVCTILLVVLAVVCFIFSAPITKAITGSSDMVADMSNTAFRIQLIFLPLLSISTMVNMLLQNIGKTVKATIVAMARQGITFIPCVLLLPLLFSTFGGEALSGLLHAQAFADLLSFSISLPIGIYECKELINLHKQYEKEKSNEKI